MAVARWTPPRRWQSRAQAFRLRPPAPVARWLFESGSLTAALQAQANLLGLRLRVQVIAEGWQRPYPEERSQLRLAHSEMAWVREVLLLADDTPWVQARSILPRASLSGMGRRLTRLGNRSLGSVLFKHPHLRRGVITLAQLPGNDRLWARRSTLGLRGHPVLVAEAFLPALLSSTNSRKDLS